MTDKKNVRNTKSNKKDGKLKPSAYEKAMENAIPQWLPYPGNKRQLIPVLMDFIPSKADRFLDLFGGTGITGIEAYARNKCRRVLYNDLEYDMTLLLEWMYITPISDIINIYNQTQERWFGDLKGLSMFEEDTQAYKKATGDHRGGVHTQLWRALVNHYNTNRIILWDREEDAEISRIINAVEDKEIRRQLNEFLNGVPTDNALIARAANNQIVREGGGTAGTQALYRYEQHQKQVRKDEREKKARAGKRGNLPEGLDPFAVRGDFFIPGELLFIMLNSFMGMQHWGTLGRSREDKTPRLNTNFRDIFNIVPFLQHLRQTPIEFYSHSFTEGWIEKKHIRERTRISQQRWRDMLSSLQPGDIVFIDPPYHGSAANYNKMYTQQMEIYLFAFCQLLTERGVPFILTDNLYYENDIFKGWIKDYYAYKLKPGALRLYSNQPQEASDGEVIISNFKPPLSRSVLKEMIEEVPGGNAKRGLIKWKTDGTITK